MYYSSLYEAIVGCLSHAKRPVLDEEASNIREIFFECTDTTDVDIYLTEAFHYDKMIMLSTYMGGDEASMDNFCILTSASVGRLWRYNVDLNKCVDLYIDGDLNIDGVNVVAPEEDGFFTLNRVMHNVHVDTWYDFEHKEISKKIQYGYFMRTTI